MMMRITRLMAAGLLACATAFGANAIRIEPSTAGPGNELAVLVVRAHVTDQTCADGVTSIPLRFEDRSPALNRVTFCDDTTIAPQLIAADLAVACEAGFVRGDCNADGEINIGDPIRLLDRLFGRRTPLPCDDAGDANDDGSVNIADPIFLLQYEFARGPVPPAPFQECGGDPTRDALTCETFARCQ